MKCRSLTSPRSPGCVMRLEDSSRGTRHACSVANAARKKSAFLGRPPGTRRRPFNAVIRDIPLLVFCVFRRIGIPPVAVLVANLAIWPVDHDFRMLTPRYGRRATDRCALSPVRRGNLLIAFAANCPTATSRHNMLVLDHLFLLLAGSRRT